MNSNPAEGGAVTTAMPSVADDAWTPTDPPYATWLSRVLAALIDMVVVMVALMIVFIVIVTLDPNWQGSFSTNGDLPGLLSDHWPSALVATGLSLGIRLLNEGVLQGRVGQSIGKRFLRIAVVDAQARRTFIGPGRGMLRVLVDYAWGIPAAFLGFLAVVPLLNYVWPLGDRRKQTWTDKVVKSVVVSIR